MARKQTPNTATGTPSQRALRVGEVIRHALSDILARGEVVDPDLDGKVVTVSEARMSRDLKIATAYVMPLGGSDTDKVIKALARNARYLRGALAPRLNLKFMPDLRFRTDETFAEADRIDALLRSAKVSRDLDDEETP